MRFLCALFAFALAACGRADARETNLPTLTVEYFQQDSARVIARWSRPCDARGCADSYRVQWNGSAVRTRAVPVDTFRLVRPVFGDSAVVTVAVTSLRRGLPGATRTAVTVVRNPDAPPPPVDSLQVDTLALMAAELDSFPEIVVRDSLGRTGFTNYPVGVPILLCAMTRNRYTGVAQLLVPGHPDSERECAVALRAFQAERDG